MATWKLGKRAQHSAPVPDRPLGVARLPTHRGRVTFLSLALSLCVAGAAAAQGGAGNSQGPAGAAVRGAGGASRPASSTQASRTFDAMKSDLRRLVGANQVYHAENGQYSTGVGALHGYRASTGVTVTILQAFEHRLGRAGHRGKHPREKLRDLHRFDLTAPDHYAGQALRAGGGRRMR